MSNPLVISWLKRSEARVSISAILHQLMSLIQLEEMTKVHYIFSPFFAAAVGSPQR